MAENSKIQWTDHTWNPWRGCTKVSEGCANCYAEGLSKRNPAIFGQWGKGKPRVKAKNWNDPRKWNRAAEGAVCCERGCEALVDGATHMCLECGDEALPYRPKVFPSLCDWLDDEVPIEWLAEFLQLIYETPHLDWLLLTKRPENFVPRLQAVFELNEWTDCADKHAVCLMIEHWFGGRAPSHVWIGTSVENQRTADVRIPELLKIPAKVRFLSLEPLLGPVDLSAVGPLKWDVLHGWKPAHEGYPEGANTSHLHWLIIGGESGPGARPCNVDWIRSLVQQGQDAGVPVFVKQLGARPGFSASETLPFGEAIKALARIRHAKGGDPAEWPEDLRVRQFPEVAP